MNDITHGTFDPDFAAVAEVFEQNFTARDEVGASVAMTVGGKSVVDLWGGHKDAERKQPWEEDTVCIVFSCTKGAVALCAHLLVSRGELDLDAPVADVWPEFAQKDKEGVTVRMMLDHSAGVPAMRQPLTPGDCCDWDVMIGHLEREEAWWPPGTRNGYHMINFGWTVGELVRRVSGRSLGTFFREELAEPLGADFWIGLPESEEPRVAPMIPWRPDPTAEPSPFQRAILEDPQGLQAMALLNTGGFDPNSPACHAAEIGGGGGISNARGLARLYAPFANAGDDFIDAETRAQMARVSMATHEDATLLVPSRFALGFMKTMDNRGRKNGSTDSVVLSDAAFGHVGAGGSIGFADPEAQLSFGYAMNRMGEGILLNERGQSLVDAAYRCLGYESNASGAWTR
ncbi:MAG: serine hydrolase domain-containing protein [Acidobacteriota bacterium]